ncbi:MAG TPA: Ku protein [Chroococcales cyanobacterium]
MARSMWSGVIGFGMVSIPISLSSATESKSVSFHQLHDKCKTRIKEVRWCPHCDQEVAWEHIVKGYEYAKGHYVTLTSDDLEQLPLPSKKLIDITAFVAEEEIDPLYYEKSYYVQPEQSGERPFVLLMKALTGKNMIAIGTIALRSRERLCALRPSADGDALVMTTLLYPDEIRKEPGLKLSDAKISKKEVDMAYSLVDLLAQKFEPENYEDHYRQALKELVDSKLEGVELEEQQVPLAKSGKVVDLMEALQASIAKAKGKEPAKSTAAKSKSKAAEKAAEPARKTKAASAKKTTAKSKKAPAAKRSRRGAA